MCGVRRTGCCCQRSGEARTSVEVNLVGFCDVNCFSQKLLGGPALVFVRIGFLPIFWELPFITTPFGIVCNYTGRMKGLH